MDIKPRDPFSVDWTDLAAVIQYAEELGPGNCVVRWDGRHNYNITHVHRVKDARDIIHTVRRKKPTVDGKGNIQT